MNRKSSVPAGLDGTGRTSEFAEVPTGTPSQRRPAPVAPSTVLGPADPFPTTLAELGLVELHVLHSRVTRQLDREHLDPAGPHPVTLDRAQELAAELDTRQEFLAPAGLAGAEEAAPLRDAR